MLEQSPIIQKALSRLLEQPEQGTLCLARVHKVGIQRGFADQKKVYDDDVKQVLIWTGFSYRNLLERSQRILQHHLNKGGYIGKVLKDVLEEHQDTTITDVCHALQKVQSNLYRENQKEDEDDTRYDRTMAPLRIQNEVVKGCYTYLGPARPDKPGAPKPGTLYLRGLKLGEKVVTPAPNGHWVPDSKPQTLARKRILEDLPSSRYCQYRLTPERCLEISVAEEAAHYAKELGIPIDPQALLLMFKVA